MRKLDGKSKQIIDIAKKDYKGWKHMNPSQILSNKAQNFAAGTWGGEFHPEFGPREGDVIVLEHWSQSGFANTDLDSQLKQLGIFRK